MSLRWGLLSTARINDALIGGIAASTTAGEVVAVASRDAERAAQYARQRGIARAHGSYEALLADPEIDAVYISLPNAQHLEWTRRALAAGKHVLCEKPLGRDAAEVADAEQLAQRADRVLAEAFMYRHHPQTRTLAELVADGAIGAPQTIRAHFAFRLDDPDDVRMQRAQDGGALMDLGCYCVSAARLIAGEPEGFAATCVRGGDGVDVAFAGALRFPGGVLAHFDASFRSAASSGLEIAGETGTLRVADPWHIHAPGIELDGPDGATRTIDIPAADSYRLQAEDFAHAVQSGEAPRVGAADAIGQARALAGLYAAAAG